MPGTAAAGSVSELAFSPQERATLLDLQAGFLHYFLDNQTSDGLVLDRQRNFAPCVSHGLCSTAATGMGFIALALASAPPHRLLSREEAILRIRKGVETAGESLPCLAGILPHFIDSTTKQVVGADAFSTIDTAWLIAGALWAGEFLEDTALIRLAHALYSRIDWTVWTAPNGLIRHGANPRGEVFPCCWDRLNGETVFLYVLAAGASEDRRWPAAYWARLGHFLSEIGGHRFGSADLGLFVFQYGLDLLDLAGDPFPQASLYRDASLAAEANWRVCKEAAHRFSTYHRFWGLSAGDGPALSGERSPGEEERPTGATTRSGRRTERTIQAHGPDVYRAYSPAGPLDGTAHITATIASIAHRPALVWENLDHAGAISPRISGRYGFSNVNLDRGWIARDMVGIDAGAAVLALDNCLQAGRIRRFFHRLGVVADGLDQIHRIARHVIAA